MEGEAEALWELAGFPEAGHRPAISTNTPNGACRAGGWPALKEWWKELFLWESEK